MQQPEGNDRWPRDVAGHGTLTSTSGPLFRDIPPLACRRGTLVTGMAGGNGSRVRSLWYSYGLPDGKGYDVTCIIDGELEQICWVL